MANIVGTQNPTWVLAANSVMGERVVNPAGEKLGEVKDLMIDIKKGCIAYAVLDFGGFLGIGGKYFGVPWDAFTVDEDNRQFVLDVSKERLQNAPGFDKDHWPMTNDQTYYNSVNQYYGTGGGMAGY